MKVLYTTVLASVGLALNAPLVFAQQNDADEREYKGGIEEIVVTAQKREEELFEIPIAISAFTGDQLLEANILDVDDLSDWVPGLETTPSNYGGGSITIRAIGVGVGGAGVDPNVAIYRDGVYMPRHEAAFQNFVDIERVEVLRGPQGTLYGRNATGGAINIISKLPGDEWEFDGRVDVASFDRFEFAASTGGAIVQDKVWGRFSYVRSTEKSYMKNVSDPNNPFREKSEDSHAFNGSLVFRPNDDLEIILRGDYEEDNGFGVIPIRKNWLGPQDSPLSLLGDGQFETTADFANTGDAQMKHWGASATINWDVNPFTVRSITAYRDLDGTRIFDGNQTNVPANFYIVPSSSKSFSQELQLLSASGGKLEWILGAYYYDEEARSLGQFGGPAFIDFGLSAFGLSGVGYTSFSHFDSTADTEAWAAFGQATYTFNENWRTTFGLRYSDETKNFRTTSDSLQVITNRDEVDAFLAGPFGPILGPFVTPIVTLLDNFPFMGSNRDSASFSAVTPRLVLEYLPNEDYLLFVSASKGFKSGGFNSFDSNPVSCHLAQFSTTQAPCTDNPLDLFQDPFDEETLWSYETGVRATLFDGRVRAAGTFFYYDYSNLQVQTITGTAVTGFINRISNNASATIKGLELELTAEPIDRLLVNLTTSWTDGEYDQFTGGSDVITADTVDFSGTKTLSTPEWKIAASAMYSILLGDYGILSPRVAYKHASNQLMGLTVTTGANDPRFLETQAAGRGGNLVHPYDGKYSTLDFSLTYSNMDGRWAVSAYVNNATNQHYRVGVLTSDQFGQQEILAKPRVYGLSVSVNY